MSTGRVLWIIWCLFWAGAWAVLAVASVLTLIGPIICLGLAALSLVAILLPVGTQATPAAAPTSMCPACGAVGHPALLGAHWQAAHGPEAGRLGPGGPPPRVIEQQPYGQGPPVRPAYGPPPGPYRPFPPPPAAGPLSRG